MKENIAFTLKALNTPGGHIVLCVVLVVIGTVGEAFKLAKADDIVIGALACLFTALKTDYAKESL